MITNALTCCLNGEIPHGVKSICHWSRLVKGGRFSRTSTASKTKSTTTKTNLPLCSLVPPRLRVEQPNLDQTLCPASQARQISAAFTIRTYELDSYPVGTVIPSVIV